MLFPCSVGLSFYSDPLRCFSSGLHTSGCTFSPLLFLRRTSPGLPDPRSLEYVRTGRTHTHHHHACLQQQVLLMSGWHLTSHAGSEARSYSAVVEPQATRLHLAGTPSTVCVLADEGVSVALYRQLPADVIGPNKRSPWLGLSLVRARPCPSYCCGGARWRRTGESIGAGVLVSDPVLDLCRRTTG